MPKSFDPPGIKSLAEIDTADDTYSDESVVIQGVVSPSSQGGWPGDNDGYEVHCFSFSAWRRLGKPVVNRELTILRSVPPRADYWDDFPKLSTQRISVLLSSDETRAVFEKAMPMTESDAELAAIASELKKPVVFTTEEFGNLTLNRNIGWFEGEATWNGEPVDLTFPADGERPDQDALNTAKILWANQTTWKARIEDYAVKELLELKNGTWLQEGERELSAEEFVGRMTLTSISCNPDGEFEFWFDDGDLFWGHSIMVSGNLTDGPDDAGIHG